MLPSYNEPHLTFHQQVELLDQRGLSMGDAAKSAEWLKRIGYYRLRPYWVALQDEEGGFKPEASLSSAVDLYIFDMKLRQCLITALEKFEVAVRVRVSHRVGLRDPLGHRKPHCLDPRKIGAHAAWLQSADNQISECREEWLADFENEFSGPCPTWMAVEAWSFAVLSKLFAIMHLNDRSSIAKEFGVNHDTLASWVRSCATVRNSCAHYNRVWNKPLINQPAVPQKWEAKRVQHISATRRTETRIYSVVAVLAHCLEAIGAGTAWRDQIIKLASAFPVHTGLNLTDAGFPADWIDEDLWN